MVSERERPTLLGLPLWLRALYACTMWRNLVVGGLCVAGLAGIAALTPPAFANGRAPGTATINFRKGMESHIAAGMTFGVVHSKDNGATWQWVCEDTVGYGGMYDPDYAYTTSGSLFATTFDGLKVNRDGCVYGPSSLSPTPPTLKFFSTVTLGSDNAVHAAASDPMDGKIYKSTDDGVTFPTSTTPEGALINDWWQSLEAAPSNPNIIYLSGYRLPSGQPKVLLLFRSDNGGATYNALPVSDFATMANSAIDIVGVDPTNPLLVYARVSLEDNSISDAIYRSTDGGATWARKLGKPSSISFVVRGNGDLVAATRAGGAFRSIDDGDTWTDLLGAPHINCLEENAAGEVWACTQNYGSPTVASDGFGIMKTTDLVTWTGVLKFEDIVAPLACPAGTIQQAKCDAELWCGLCAQLGCDPGRVCGAAQDVTPPPKAGCCQSGGDGVPGFLVLGGALGFIVLRRRRRRCCA